MPKLNHARFCRAALRPDTACFSVSIAMIYRAANQQPVECVSLGGVGGEPSLPGMVHVVRAMIASLTGRKAIARRVATRACDTVEASTFGNTNVDRSHLMPWRRPRRPRRVWKIGRTQRCSASTRGEPM